jgi:hypothetical protein
MDEHGIATFEELDVADAGVGDVRVHARGAMPGRSGTGAAWDSMLSMECCVSSWVRLCRHETSSVVWRSTYLVVSPSSDMLPILVLTAGYEGHGGSGRDPVVRSGTGLQTGLWSGPRSVWSAVS